MCLHDWDACKNVCATRQPINRMLDEHVTFGLCTFPSVCVCIYVCSLCFYVERVPQAVVVDSVCGPNERS